MSVRLTVRREEWLAHVRRTAEAYGPGLVPVVKGNGYGFGRALLHETAATLSDAVCVGSVHEHRDAPTDRTVVALTPTLDPPASTSTDLVCTVGSPAHVRPLDGRGGRVLLKLASSMRRYGATPDELPALRRAVDAAGLEVLGHSLHLPLAGGDDDRLREVEAWLRHLEVDVPLWLSHLTPDSFAELSRRHPDRRFRIRVGTAIWHGVPRADFLHLDAEVLSIRTVRRGEVAGYHATPVPFDGTLVAVGAGTAHGVAPLDHEDPARRSPFHFGRRRLTMLERPHMHTTLLVVAPDQPTPEVGDRVDLQRPLVSTLADELVWT